MAERGEGVVMDKAYLIGVDVNSGIGPRKWDPPLSWEFEARLANGTASEQELKNEMPSLSLMLNRLSRGRVADVIGMSTGPFTVCPAIKEYLEQHEPSVHRFFPIRVRTSKPVDGKTEHGTHWLLYPPAPIDCLDFARTIFNEDRKRKAWSRERDDGRPWGGGVLTDAFPECPCTLIGSMIEGRHIWRVRTGAGYYADYACSPEFWAFYKRNKMIGWIIEKTCKVN